MNGIQFGRERAVWVAPDGSTQRELLPLVRGTLVSPILDSPYLEQSSLVIDQLILDNITNRDTSLIFLRLYTTRRAHSLLLREISEVTDLPFNSHRSSEELGGFVNAEQAGSKRPIVCCPCRFGVCWNPTCIWMSWGESGQPTCPTVSGGDFIDGIAVIPS